MLIYRRRPITGPEPGLQLGDEVNIDGASPEEAVEQGPLVQVEQPDEELPTPLGVVDPDRLPEGARESAGEEAVAGAPEREELPPEEEEAVREEPTPVQVRQFSGATAFALPAYRGQHLERLDLEVQIQPNSPNGMILYAASSTPPNSKEPPPIVHSLELVDGRLRYAFKMGKETMEELYSDQKVPLGQWSTLRLTNDGWGRASLRVNSAPPEELFYTPSTTPIVPNNRPPRIFLGGIDPARAADKTDVESVNFIGAIGRVRLNQQEVNFAPRNEEDSEEGKSDEQGQESHLQQTENECSREPCRNGGQCRLDRWGGFQCQCTAGFSGPLCQLPSTDGVCPEDGRRWCHRGICSRNKSDTPQCHCPPGWLGPRCGKEQPEIAGPIRFDGRHSFLAIPLDFGRDLDEEDEETGQKGFSVEFRLSLEPSRASTDQLVALLVGADSAETPIGVLGIEAEKFWALHKEDDEPATKRFLSKRIKSSKKTHRVRLEQAGPGELRLSLSGRPKGTLPAPTEKGSLLLLGGLPPRGISMPEGVEDVLAEAKPFAGCLDAISVNGRKLTWPELSKLTAANLASCEPKMGEKPPTDAREEVEDVPETPEPTAETTAVPVSYTSPLPVVSVSEDPLLTVHEQIEGTMAPEGVDDADEEIWHGQVTGTHSPDPLPPSTERTLVTPATPQVEIEPSEEPTEETTTEEPTEEPTLFTPSSTFQPEDEPTTLMPIPGTPSPTPTWMFGPETELEPAPFPGLCHANTCGPHGTCEELNSSHVLCACRDYWVGQTCEQFRPIEYAASFDGSAFVVFSSDEFPHLVSDREEVIEFKLRTRARYGLIFWQGQQPRLEDWDGDILEAATALYGEDFLSIGLLDGHLAFSYELGGGAAQLISERPVNDGRAHTIRAVRKGRNGTLHVDNEAPVRGRSSGILAMLNVEGHIFVGGVPDLHLMTAGVHTHNFVGCLAELAMNGQKLDLMANAIDGRNVRPCKEWRPQRLKRRRHWLRLLRRQRMRLRKDTRN